MKHLRIALRVVFYRDEGRWIAHCLEFDLCGDGDTREDALESLTGAIRVQVDELLEHGNPKNLFTPADGRFFEMFAAGKDIAMGQLHLKMEFVEVESTETREYSDDDLVCA